MEGILCEASTIEEAVELRNKFTVTLTRNLKG